MSTTPLDADSTVQGIAIAISFQVRNTSARRGTVVPQLYYRDNYGSVFYC